MTDNTSKYQNKLFIFLFESLVKDNKNLKRCNENVITKRRKTKLLLCLCKRGAGEEQQKERKKDQ